MNREELLAVREVDTKPVPVGGKVYHVRSMSAGEMVDFDAEIKAAGDDVHKLLAVQLSTFLSDASGAKQLSVEEARNLCDRIKATTVQEIVEAGMALNALTSKSQEQLQGN